MEKADKHIYPVFSKILKRSDKEALLDQKGKVIGIYNAAIHAGQGWGRS